jgi:tetrahydromethanopterin S-methyltransferase subunit C
MAQLVFRFLVGGLIVSLFAALADVLKPKSFAGLFGAAPSVGLATLALTVVAFITCRLLTRFRWRALRASVITLL